MLFKRRSSAIKNEEGIRPEVFNRVSNLRKAGFSDKEIISVVSLNDREKELLKLENTLNSIKKETKEKEIKESIKIIRRKEIKENNNSKEENKTTKEEIYNIIDDLSLELLTDDVFDQFEEFGIRRDKIEKLIIDIILNDPSIVKKNNYIYTCMKLCSAIEDLITENTIGGIDDQEKDELLEELNSLLD